MANNNFGAWGTPEGGFNWNMLTNVGAGMLANSQYSPGQAFGKGYEQASANSLEQAKAGLLFQDAEQKRQQYKIHNEMLAALAKNPLMNGQGGGPQPAPTAGANLGMPAQQQPMQDPGAGYVGGQSSPIPPPPQMAQAAPAAQPQQGGAPQAGGFDTDTFNKLVTLSAKLKSLGEDDAAQGVMSKATAMKTLYDVENNREQLNVARGNLGLQREQFQAGEVHKGRDENLNERKFFDETQGKPAREQIKTLSEQEITARSSNAKMGLMRQYAGNQGFYSGRWGENVALPFKQALKAFGLPGAEGVDSMEAFNSLGKQGVMDLAGGSLGRQISDADVKAMNAQVATLNNTPEGNARIMDILEKTNERKIEYAKQARAFYKQNKSLEGFDDQFSAYADAHPLFADMKALPSAAPGVEGGGDTAPKPSAAPPALHFDRATGKISRVTPTEQPQAPAEYPAPGTQWPPMMPPAQPAAAGAQPGWMQKMFGGQ